MMFRKLVLCSLFALITLPATAGDDDAAKKDLAKMEGVWQLASAEEDGKPSSDFLVENLRMEFKGDRLIPSGVKPVTDKVGKMIVKLDASAKPKCIDLKVESGELKGMMFEGIYEWKGDELRLCLFMGEGLSRPSEFTAKPGSNRVLFQFKREKK